MVGAFFVLGGVAGLQRVVRGSFHLEIGIRVHASIQSSDAAMLRVRPGADKVRDKVEDKVGDKVIWPRSAMHPTSTESASATEASASGHAPAEASARKAAARRH